ncbi:hypothetical protein GLOTRDRAFT_128228 [Gloeophyllum trabeum ATCC 11539]|uniref:BTB domain-containing protein n=1 Tax=Gloeophyllum trabeum (strain ATCC 11539 / FP-39264 / Madison 617) TaxID=670483 RepID=S7RT45_GLOTA|nr:uncharacterized protein GLOTRDRAFT_128228 [Gloeophyllum trabeum ATCC 11539]EPQ56279.1 hypothetical protein GLOTRDRAFT_128228 [Gloeophyllum trabeum ATCC 11539]
MRTASPPFDRDSADLIFRTTDGVDFLVHKAILAIASPLHNDASEAESMGVSPDAKVGDHGGETQSRTVISVSEDSETIDKLLRLVYPVAPPALETLDALKPVLEAAVKYQMESVLELLRKKLVSQVFLEEEPLRVFAITCYHGFEEETRVAAMYTCYKGLPGPNVRELRSITASATRALWELKDKASVSASSVVTNLSWMSECDTIQRSWAFFSCSQCSQSSREINVQGVMVWPRAWWDTYMASIGQELMRAPCGMEVTSPRLFANAAYNIASSHCSFCRDFGKGLKDLTAFNRILAARVDKAVLEIAATIDFQ